MRCTTAHGLQDLSFEKEKCHFDVRGAAHMQRISAFSANPLYTLSIIVYLKYLLYCFYTAALCVCRSAHIQITLLIEKHDDTQYLKSKY